MEHLLFWLHNLEDINTIWTVDNFAHSCQKHPLGLHKTGWTGGIYCGLSYSWWGQSSSPFPWRYLQWNIPGLQINSHYQWFPTVVSNIFHPPSIQFYLWTPSGQFPQQNLDRKCLPTLQTFFDFLSVHVEWAHFDHWRTCDPAWLSGDRSRGQRLISDL